MARGGDKGKGKGKGKAKGKGKVDPAGAPTAGPRTPSVAAHPRAQRALRRIKGWAGLAGFALVGLMAWRAGAPPADVVARALAGGVAAFLAAWAGGVAVWRHVVLAELRLAKRRALQAREARAPQEASPASQDTLIARPPAL